MGTQLFLGCYEGIQLFLYFILKFISIFFANKKLRHFLKLRSPQNFYQNVRLAQENFNNTPIYWFHVSSAGEMEQAIPVARKLHEKLGVSFFVTYYSYSTEPFLKNFPATIGVAGLPLDMRFVYKKLFQTLPISKIFFVRYDIWPSLLLSCKENNLEINLISATKIKTKKGLQALVSEKWNCLFYKYFTSIFTVSEEDLNYFKNILPQEKVYLAGDAKWARANERAHSQVKANSDPIFSHFIHSCKQILEKRERKILVIGSPHKEEHELVLKLSVIKKYFFIIYVPHEVETKSIQSLFSNLTNTGFRSKLYSELKADSLVQNEREDLIIIDRIGFLAEIYQIADAAIIGGGFDGQIHNVLEAAAAGVPTLFGSSYARAREASQLIQANAALSFESINNLFHFLSTWVNFENEYRQPLHPGSHDGETSLKLEGVKMNALRLFQNLPDTSEVIFNAIHKA